MTRRISSSYGLFSYFEPLFLPTQDRRHHRVDPEDWRPGRGPKNTVRKRRPEGK